MTGPVASAAAGRAVESAAVRDSAVTAVADASTRLEGVLLGDTPSPVWSGVGIRDGDGDARVRGWHIMARLDVRTKESA
ncbi:hypothetical protein GCM10026982_56760 [Nocardiopsis aegyptia]